MSQPFACLHNQSAQTIHNCLKGETPLFAGVVLGYLPPQVSAKVLANMSADRQREVVDKMKKARSAPTEVVERLEASVEQKLAAPATPEPAARAWSPRKVEQKAVNVDQTEDERRKAAMERILTRGKGDRPALPQAPAGKKVDGMALAAEILRFAGGSVRHNVSDHVPELYGELKGRMFGFDDLERTVKDHLARIFTAVEPATVALALRFASSRLTGRVMESVSSRLAHTLRDEIDLSSRGRVRVCDVEDAQAKILKIAMKLQAEGKVVIDPDDPDLV